MSLGGESSILAQRNAADIMQRTLDAIQRGDEGIRELGELIHYYGDDVVLKMAEVHDYLEYLARKTPSALDRVLGRGRGRRRVDHLYTVVVIEALIEDTGCSVAEAARVMASGRLRHLNMSPRGIENAYHKHKEHRQHLRKGFDIPPGVLLTESWPQEHQR